MDPQAINAYTIALQAYMYGFAGVEMERIRCVITNTTEITAKQVLMNQILHNTTTN